MNNILKNVFPGKTRQHYLLEHFTAIEPLKSFEGAKWQIILPQKHQYVCIQMYVNVSVYVGFFLNGLHMQRHTSIGYQYLILTALDQSIDALSSIHLYSKSEKYSGEGREREGERQMDREEGR